VYPATHTFAYDKVAEHYLTFVVHASQVPYKSALPYLTKVYPS